MHLIELFDFLNLVSGIITLILGLFSFRPNQNGYHKMLSYLLFSISLWNFATLFEYLSKSLEGHIFWVSVSYIGIVFAPLYLFLFLFQYTHFNRPLPKRFLPFLFIIPILSNIFIWFPTTRLFVWTSVTLKNTPWGVIANFDHGWWSYIQIYYSFILVGFGVFYLIRGLSLFPQKYNKQIIVLLIISIIPTAVSYLYMLNSDRLYGLDATSVAISLSIIIFYFVISKQQLLQQTPIPWNYVVENINEGILIISNNRQIIGTNPSSKKLIQSLLPTYDESPLVMDLFKEYPEIIAFINATDEIRNTFFIRDQWFEVTKNPVLDKAGMTSGQILILYNITDIKRKEAEIDTYIDRLKKANNTKDMIFRVISHDLKGPVGNLNSLLALLFEQNKPLDMNHMEALYKTSSNASFLIENLLYWANCQWNETKIELTCNPLSDTVSCAIDTLALQASNKKITINNSCDNNINAYYDAPTIEIVIRNLISNAIKFSQPGDSINISTEKSVNQISLHVIDHGIGIPDETLQMINDNGIVQSQFGTLREKGTGIGLPMCKQLVKSNKGTLNISSSLSKGTTVTITLPACPCN